MQQVLVLLLDQVLVLLLLALLLLRLPRQMSRRELLSQPAQFRLTNATIFRGLVTKYQLKKEHCYPMNTVDFRDLVKKCQLKKKLLHTQSTQSSVRNVFTR